MPKRKLRKLMPKQQTQRPAVPMPPPPPLSLPPRQRLALPAGTYCNGVKQEAHELLALKHKLRQSSAHSSNCGDDVVKAEQLESLMEAGESDQDDYTELCENTIVSCDDDEDDIDANCIISSNDDANLLCRHDFAMAAEWSAKWSEYVSRSMTCFLRYIAFEQGLLTDSGWIQLGTLVRHLQLGACCERLPTWKANIYMQPSMISTHDVLHEVKQNGKPGKLPYFELFMRGQRAWVRATPGKRRHQ